MAEEYVDSGKPQSVWSWSAPGFCFSSLTIDCERVSVQTIPLWRGSPVSWSQTIVVSRWLVIPMHFMFLRLWPAVSNFWTASSMQVSTDVIISRASCSCQLFWLGLGFERYRLHLPRMRVDLAELDLVGCNWFAVVVKNQESGTCCTLID